MLEVSPFSHLLLAPHFARSNQPFVMCDSGDHRPDPPPETCEATVRESSVCSLKGLRTVD